MWFDSHCHLHLCGSNDSVDEVVERARRAGVDQMLTVGIDLESSRASIDLATRHGVWAAVGIHPNESNGWNEEMADALRSLVTDDRVAAIGESGLDFYRDAAPRSDQEPAFESHIELAKDTGKALVIHTRDSVGDAIDLLTRVGPPEKLVFHCWSGSVDQMEAALGLGAYISFAGNVSFKSAGDLRDVAAQVPGDRLLVETDSPFLSPEPLRGKSNEPRQVSFVGVAVAQARGVGTKTIAALTSANARGLFGE